MCDCYEVPCEQCRKSLIQIHIADFCVPRKSVQAFCPKCVKSWAKEGSYEQMYDGKKCKKVFLDQVVIGESVIYPSVGKKFIKARKGDVVVILCDDEDAYGIHLN